MNTTTATNRSMTSTERAAAIRGALKSRLGLTSKDVSVRVDSYSMGATVCVRAKSATVRLPEVRAVAQSFERVSRCEATGEILGGGNTYVDIEYTSEAIAPLRAQIFAALEAGESAPGVSVSVHGIRIFVDDQGYWRTTSDELRLLCWGRDNAARQLAVHILSVGGAS